MIVAGRLAQNAHADRGDGVAVFGKVGLGAARDGGDRRQRLLLHDDVRRLQLLAEARQHGVGIERDDFRRRLRREAQRS